MPDSQLPPLWGPAYDERDLDALLSGRTGSTPAALRPVESTLAALRADATGRELAREAAARAAFRAFAPRRRRAVLGGPSRSHARPSPGRRPAGPAPRRRHRHRRPAARARAQARPRGDRRRRDRPGRGRGRGHRRPDRLDRGAHVVRAAARQRQRVRPRDRARTRYAGAAGDGRRPGCRPRARRRPTASAHATPRPTSGPGSLCREFFEYPEHPVPGGAAAWFALGGQLSKLAGGPFKVYGYCLRYLDNPLAGRGGWPMIGPAPRPGASGRGRPGSGSVSPANGKPGERQSRGRRPREPGQSGRRG